MEEILSHIELSMPCIVGFWFPHLVLARDSSSKVVAWTQYWKPTNHTTAHSQGGYFPLSLSLSSLSSLFSPSSLSLSSLLLLLSLSLPLWPLPTSPLQQSRQTQTKFWRSAGNKFRWKVPSSVVEVEEIEAKEHICDSASQSARPGTYGNPEQKGSQGGVWKNWLQSVPPPKVSGQPTSQWSWLKREQGWQWYKYG